MAFEENDWDFGLAVEGPHLDPLRFAVESWEVFLACDVLPLLHGGRVSPAITSEKQTGSPVAQAHSSPATTQSLPKGFTYHPRHHLPEAGLRTGPASDFF